MRSVDTEWGAAGDKHPNPAAEGLADFGVDEFVGQFPQAGSGLASAIDNIAMLGAHANGEGKQAFLDWRFTGAALHFLADLFVDAGHADEHGGLDLAHRLGQHVEFGAVDDLRAAAIHHVVEGTGGDVRERQKRNAHIAGVEGVFVARVVLIGGDITVGEHHPLGFAGGAGRVDKGGQVFGFNRLRQRVEDRIALAAALVGPGEQLAEGDRARGRGNRIHDHDAFEMGSGADRVELVVLLAGGDDGDAATGILDQHGDLVAGQGGINGDVGGADGERGEVGDGPFPAILSDEGNTVAFLHAPLEQSLSQRAHALVELVGRDGAPAAELILPQHRLGVGPRYQAAEMIINGGDRGDGCHLACEGRREFTGREQSRV